MSWERARSFFPVTRELVYLDHAGIGPLSSRAFEALTRYAEEVSRQGSFNYPHVIRAEAERVRARAAQLLGSAADEVSFVGSAEEGLARVARGFAWRRGDRIVACELEPSANLAVFQGLRDRGVEVQLLAPREGALPLDAVRRAFESPRARLLLVSFVQPATGARSDLVALGALCRERGVLICVDASQSVGCLPLDTASRDLDFVVAPGHRWLLSVEGCGLFYCARRVADLLDPLRAGLPPRARGAAGAARFDSPPNPAGIFALGASIDLILETGVERIAERVLSLCARLADGLETLGADLVSPRAPGATSGIVVFTLPSEAAERTVARLRRRGIAVSACDGAVRVSPHFYNSEDEIDALLGALR
ncbi:MAG: aminotransferase class V-fold PLP-dependent enzyme [Deltaproteobacteria bacterium]|nr:MAG: aminotransferase class V-fold PLP-dependent enzyme [Deltaproteobacteria bacterium]